jgi:hypothetical protein
VRRAASFSRDGRYRYSLRRAWSDGPAVTWVLLNPSTADARVDDPTIRRCIGFSRRWGFGALEVVNLFALRATDPKILPRAPDPVGASNDAALRRALARSAVVVAAWGEHGRLHGRSARVRRWLPDGALALGLNASGEPVHPLYVPGNRVAVLLGEALADGRPERLR